MKSKNTVYLHIGAPKTGTSAIQKSLFNNRKLLVKHGFIYPDYGQQLDFLGIPDGNETKIRYRPS